MFNHLLDIQCSVSQITKEGLTCVGNILDVKATWFSAVYMWGNFANSILKIGISCTT